MKKNVFNHIKDNIYKNVYNIEWFLFKNKILLFIAINKFSSKIRKTQNFVENHLLAKDNLHNGRKFAQQYPFNKWLYVYIQVVREGMDTWL